LTVSKPDLDGQTAPPVSGEEFARLRQARHGNPAAIAAALASRMRPLARGDGRLFIVAADHPARGSLSVGQDPMAMASRYDLLQRLVLALSRPG
jgi:hypothetical protein